MSTLSSYCCCHCVRSILLRFLSFLRVQKQRKPVNQGGYQINICSCSFTLSLELKLSHTHTLFLTDYVASTPLQQQNHNKFSAVSHEQFSVQGQFSRVWRRGSAVLVLPRSFVLSRSCFYQKQSQKEPPNCCSLCSLFFMSHGCFFALPCEKA